MLSHSMIMIAVGYVFMRVFTSEKEMTNYVKDVWTGERSRLYAVK